MKGEVLQRKSKSSTISRNKKLLRPLKERIRLKTLPKSPPTPSASRSERHLSRSSRDLRASIACLRNSWVEIFQKMKNLHPSIPEASDTCLFEKRGSPSSRGNPETERSGPFLCRFFLGSWSAKYRGILKKKKKNRPRSVFFFHVFVRFDPKPHG